MTTGAPLDWTAVRLQRIDARKPLRRLPGLVADAARLLWRTSPRRFAASTVIQLLLATGAALQVVAGRDALALVLESPRSGADVAQVVPPLLTVGAVTALVHLLRSAAVTTDEGLQLEVAQAALHEVLDVASTVELEAFESPEFFDRLQRAKFAARDRPWATAQAFIGLLASVLGFLALGSVLAALEPILLPFVIVATIPGLTVATRLTRARHRLHILLAQDQRREQYLVDVLTGRSEAKEVRSFNLAPGLRRMHEALAGRRIRESLLLARRSARERLIATVLSSASTGVGVFLLVMLVVDGRLDPAGAAAAGYAMQRIQSWLSGATRNITSLYNGALFLDDYAAFLRMGRDAGADPPANDLAGPFELIGVDHLSFTYPGSDRPALADIDLEIRAGQVVALVGENGSGKTTLAKLLSGLYRPTQGRITWDGVDLATVDPDQVRDQVAAIFQDFARYRLTARENIGLGRDERLDDLDAIAAAARAAGAAEFLEALPEGYDSLLAKDLAGGSDLSVGQWQRVALARAFFRDAPFLVLDEPTAALDAKAEHALFERIRHLAAGRTVLLISHRFSSVRNADVIFVLDHGQLVERGSHGDLVDAGGLYGEMFKLQADAYLSGPERPSERVSDR